MIPATILTILQLADAWTTHRVLSSGGRELNPVLAWLFDRVGHVAGLIVIKSAVIAMLWLALPTINSLPFGAPLLWVLVAVYVAIVGNNLRAMRG